MQNEKCNLAYRQAGVQNGGFYFLYFCCMSQEIQEMVEHIDQATSPEQRSIRAFISQNLHFM
jgi:predicted transcriptional regulator